MVSRLEDDVDDVLYSLAVKEEETTRVAYRQQVKLYARKENELKVAKTIEELRRKAELQALQQATQRQLASAQKQWNDANEVLRQAQFKRY